VTTRSRRIFNASLHTDETAFAAALPDFDANRVVIYFMPSFGHFEGQTHDLGTKIGVLFGVDRMAGEKNVNPGVIVAHELYHIYQYESHPNFKTSDLVLWEAIWGEGSAAYASQMLTPGASEAQALDEKLAAAPSSVVQQLACGIESHWSQHTDEIFADYFDAGESPPGLPQWADTSSDTS